MRHLKLLCAALFLILAACTPPPVSASPAPFALPVEVVADTVKVTIAPCAVSGSAVACRVTLTGTVGTAPIAFGTIPNFTPGESRVITKTITCVANAVVTVNGSSEAINSSGVASAPTAAAPAVFTCADPVPGAPGAWTIILQVVVP